MYHFAIILYVEHLNKNYEDPILKLLVFRLLSHFYSQETAGRFPGKGETIVLRTRRTLPYFIFWGGLLAATLSSEKGRSLYIKSWSIMGLSSILYMAAMYDWLQA